MIEIYYTTDHPIVRSTYTLLIRAVRRVWPDTQVEFFTAEPTDERVLRFGEDTLSPREWTRTVNVERHLAAALRKHVGLPQEPLNKPVEGRVLYLDIESYEAEMMWDMDPDEFCRLLQYSWDDEEEVHLVTDRQHVIDVIESADCTVVHNGHAFDWTAIYGKDSTRPLELAKERRLFDTMVFAVLAFPAPTVYVKRDGKKAIADKPEQIQAWLSLDNLSYQLGLTGKIGDLKALAKKYGGFGKIPLDDPEFVEYAIQDIVALKELCHELIAIAGGVSEYDWREQLNAAIDAQNSRNGFKVDLKRAQHRVNELATRREVILRTLESKYGFPNKGKSPWATKAGKEAIMSALADFGITPETHHNWEKTATGNLSLGGPAIKALCAGVSEEAEEFAAALGELKGQRSLAQLAIDSVHADGKAHPRITSLQRSGRKSTTKPGLTVWSARGEKAIEKSYFVPDNENEFLVELDYSNADQRVVAAYSGDTVYLERMEEGFDGHEMSGRFLFGDEVYDSNPKKYRQIAKPAGHGWAYRASWRAVQRGTNCTAAQAMNFLEGMDGRYSDVVRWQNEMSSLGERGYLINAWGRRMIVESGRSFTQSPALMGQSGTREIMVDALIRMLDRDIRLITYLKAQVHDALVFSIPETELDWAVPAVVDCMETSWQPPDGSGQLIHFPVSAGKPARDWQEAGH